MKKILAILGSPKENGNLSKMLDVAVKQAEKLNHKVTFINLYEKKIAYCKGCVHCKKTGICIIDDDINEIREHLINCDTVIMASPVYFANVSAIVKNVFDRLVGAVMDDNTRAYPKPKLSPKQNYILMTACNTPFPFDRIFKQSSGCISAMKEFFHISGMKSKGKVIYAGTRNKNGLPSKIVRKIENIINKI